MITTPITLPDQRIVLPVEGYYVLPVEEIEHALGSGGYSFRDVPFDGYLFTGEFISQNIHVPKALALVKYTAIIAAKFNKELWWFKATYNGMMGQFVAIKQ